MRDEADSTDSPGGHIRPPGVVLLVALVGILGVLCWTPRATADSPSDRKGVLLLYGESRVVPAILEIDEAIRARFESAGVEAPPMWAGWPRWAS
jgi:hypothetical protein